MSKRPSHSQSQPGTKETLADVFSKANADDAQARAEELSLLDALKRTSERPLSTREKVEGTKKLAQALAEPQNHRVAFVFVLTTMAMFTLPLIALGISHVFIAPALNLEDPDTFNAGVAVATTLLVVVAYVIYAFKSEALTTPGDGGIGVPPKRKME